MQNENIIITKPKKPWGILAGALFFLMLSLFLFISDQLNLAMGILAFFLLGVALCFLWMTDRAYMTLEFGENQLKLKGYFSFRQLCLKDEEFQGYELNEAVTHSDSLHKNICIRTKQGKLIIFPKGAYTNYSKLRKMISEKYDFLEFKPCSFAFAMRRQSVMNL
jgi:hypothetical protein